ncbi:MAG TPA: HIT family protein [Candidatus Paceibacterota bacterium]|nr:HIT family protein [Candidatus Paceibacterota bacterium]
MDDCVFCKIIAGEIPSYKLYEDEHTLAFLDVHPVNPGHTLVIPKEHHRNIFDIPEEALARVTVVAQKVSLAIQESIGAEGVTLRMNNEPAGGQDVFHAHLHVIPRHKRDDLSGWPQHEYADDAAMKEIGEKLRTKLG